MKFELQVDEEYMSLVAPLTKLERRALKLDIMENGQQVDIICNQDGIILDGHHRSEICEELGIKPKYVVRKFNSKDDERSFVLRNTIFRRNLNPWQKFEHAWKLYYKKPTQIKVCIYCKGVSFERHGGTQKTRFGKEQRFKCRTCGKHLTLTSVINHEIKRVREYIQNYASIGIAKNTVKLCVQIQTTVSDARLIKQLRSGTITVGQLRKRILRQDQMKVIPVRTDRKHSATKIIQDKAKKAITFFEGRLFNKYDLQKFLNNTSEHTSSSVLAEMRQQPIIMKRIQYYKISRKLAKGGK